MLKCCSAACGLITCIFLLIAPCSYSQSGAKKVTSQADLPRFSYPVAGSASGLVQADDATFDAFASKVRADLDSVLRDCEIDDKSTMRTLLSTKLNLRELSGEHQAALETVEALRGLEEKPASKLTTGLFARARLQAAIETQTSNGPVFEQAFTRRFSEAINSLPWDVVQDWAKRSYVNARIYTKPYAIGYVMTDLDPAAQKSKALDNQEAWDLIGVRDFVKFGIPVRSVSGKVLYRRRGCGWLRG
jgi:hypothetical protein